MMLRKWTNERPRRPAGQTLFWPFDEGGLELSKMPSISGSGAIQPPECRLRRHGPRWRVAKSYHFHKKRRPSWTSLTFTIYTRVLGDQYTKIKLKSSTFQHGYSCRTCQRQCQTLNRCTQGFGWGFLPPGYCILQ